MHSEVSPSLFFQETVDWSLGINNILNPFLLIIIETYALIRALNEIEEPNERASVVHTFMRMHGCCFSIICQQAKNFHIIAHTFWQTATLNRKYLSHYNLYIYAMPLFLWWEYLVPCNFLQNIEIVIVITFLIFIDFSGKKELARTARRGGWREKQTIIFLKNNCQMLHGKSLLNMLWKRIGGYSPPGIAPGQLNWMERGVCKGQECDCIFRQPSSNFFVPWPQ